jgi:hypothetical protein
LLATERIRNLAHQLWEQQGRPTGCDLDHWLQAERQLSRETIAAVATSIPKKGKRAAGGKAKKKG